MVLNGCTYIPQTATGDGLLNAEIESLLCGAEQLHHLGLHIAHGKGVRAVRMKSVEQNTTIHRDDIAILEHHFIGRYPMHHLLINRSTERGRESFVTKARGLTPVIHDKLVCYLVQLGCRNTRLDDFCQFGKSLTKQDIALAHQFNLFVCLKEYHLFVTNT